MKDEQRNGSEQERSIKITIDSLYDLQLRHLGSGINEDDRANALTGYTEWVCDSMPLLSIGWDWQMNTDIYPFKYEMVGLPFTNIVVVDGRGNTFSYAENLETLAHFISTITWVDEVLASIKKRYQ